jgi:MFS family permease
MLTNLGLGLGAFLGGVIADTSNPHTFAILFLVDAATFAAFAAVAVRVSERNESAEEAGAGNEGGSYRLVLRDRRFTQFLVINLAFVIFGFVPLVTFLPIYGQTDAGLQELLVGTLLAINTAVVVAAQLSVSRLMEGRRRMPCFSAVAVAFAISWLLVAAGGEMQGGGGFALMVLAVALFAVAECIYNVVATPLALQLAPHHMMSRYLATFLLVFAIGRAIAPPTEGWLLGVAPVGYWVVMASALLGVGLWILRLEAAIPEEARLTPTSAADPV